jgi:hypothetical protein
VVNGASAGRRGWTWGIYETQYSTGFAMLILGRPRDYGILKTAKIQDAGIHQMSQLIRRLRTRVVGTVCRSAEKPTYIPRLGLFNDQDFVSCACNSRQVLICMGALGDFLITRPIDINFHIYAARKWSQTIQEIV